MILTKEQILEMKVAAMPLMLWLGNTCHPHVTVVVTSQNAEALEGLARVIKDGAAQMGGKKE